MVRLKAAGQSPLIHPYMFQFHYGTIKRTATNAVAKIVASFNSTMVRLKGLAILPGRSLVYKFQFHYGTIKSPLKTHYMLIMLRFQFHYGTIKSFSIYFE